MEIKKAHNILFVDNHHKNIKDSSSYLKDLSEFELYFISEDENIAKYVLDKNIDCVIIDITTSRKFGLELCSILKKKKEMKNIPLILLTKNSDIESMIKGFKLGANDCIQKPFNTRILISRINTQIENKILKDALYDEIKNKNSMLLQQSKQAVMGNMIDTIIHQWKQPLSIIDLYRLAMDHQLKDNHKINDEVLKKNLNGIKNQVIFLNDTLLEFKDFFRPKNKVKNIHVEDVFNSVNILLKDLLIKNNIKLNIKSTPSHVLKIVPNELKHVLVNLINNAKDAFNENKIKKPRVITLSSSREEDKLIITIEDNAGGIPKNVINRVFQREFSTKKESEGTGIGLYISQMIVNKYNGDISVKNSEQGAIFNLKFKKEGEKDV